MPEGIDEAAGAFATEIAPPSRPRDQTGKFVRESKAPEPMFGLRPVEGDPLTGDTSDGGDDPRLRAREREIADGREQGDRRAASEEERQGVQRRRANGEGDGHADADDGYDIELDEPEDTAKSDSDAADGEEGSADERYEVTVDGEPKEVTLQEALNGYIRQETFHKRNAQLLNVQQELEGEHQRLMQNWQIWHKARKDYEEDLGNMIPREPDWDQEFAKDPRAAHDNQKVYQVLYGRLNASQQARAVREAAEAQESDRRVQKYAVEGFAKFVALHPKIFPDEPTLKKNIQSMRRTGADAGFSDYEVATVYDPRMLTVLLWASKYRRMMAAQPRAVVPGKNRTLAPGAATPFGNARRSGFDDAQRRLASSGRLQDAVEVFRRML